jgi:hypothetical protein
MENTTQCSNDKKKFRVIKSLKIPVYECTVQFIITDMLIDEVNRIYKKYDIHELFTDYAEGCLITSDIDLYIIILEDKYLSHNTIAHELYHLVTRMTQDRDIEDDEQQAWLCGWITEHLYKFISKKNLTVK